MASDIELTTMCTVLKEDKVLMINRTNGWNGWAFLGGHVEKGESVDECVKREMMEEAGIAISSPIFKGITNIFNTENFDRHIIFNYICFDYNGKIKDTCDEGIIKWIKIDKINSLDLAEGMNYRIPLFLEYKKQELYIEWDNNNGYTKVVYSDM